MSDAIPENLQWFVDRTPQFSFFAEMLAGQRETAVMIVEADQGMGKSILLQKMRHHCRANDIHVVHVDFRDDYRRGVHDYLWLIRAFIDQLDGPAAAGAFDALIQTINQWTAVATAATPSAMREVAVLVPGQADPVPVLVDLAAVRRLLADNFQLADLNALIFDLGVDNPESIAGDTPQQKALSLLTYSEDRGLLGRLLGSAAAERSNLTWWQMPDAAPAAPEAPETAAPAGAVQDLRSEALPEDKRRREQAEAQINAVFVDALQAVAAANPLVVLFDSYEDAAREARAWIHTFLVDAIVDGNIDGARMIIAGRTAHELADRRPIVRKGGLGKLDKSFVAEYLTEKRGIQVANIDEIYDFTGRGIPQLMANMAAARVSVAGDDDWD